MQPLKFRTAWLNLHQILRNQPNANKTALVWAPFEGNNYPFGDYQFSPRANTEEFFALDTNSDGILDNADGKIHFNKTRTRHFFPV